MSERQNELIAAPGELPVPVSVVGNDNFSLVRLEKLWKWAVVYSKSGVVPPHFAKPEAAFVAVELADRSGLPVMLLMQEVYLIHGRPAMSGKLAIALLRRSGVVKSGPTYEIERSPDGKKVLRCTCTVIDSQDGQPRTETLEWATVEAEGWHKPRKDQPSKWLTDPDQMFCYRTSMRLIRRCYPDVILGLYTPEEIDEIDRRVVPGQVTENVPTLSHKQASMQEKVSAVAANDQYGVANASARGRAILDQIDDSDVDQPEDDGPEEPAGDETDAYEPEPEIVEQSEIPF